MSEPSSSSPPPDLFSIFTRALDATRIAELGLEREWGEVTAALDGP